MKTFRIILTKSSTVGSVVDFAAADNAENSKITHDNLLKLRQYKTPDAESLLPPMLLRDEDGNISVTFEKEEKATDEDRKVLAANMPLIRTSYNKLKHQGRSSTLEITPETLAIAFSFINPHKMEVKSPEDERLRRDLEESQRLLRVRPRKFKSFRGD